MNPSIWTGMYAELPLHEAIGVLHECGWTSFEISTEHLVQIETSKTADSLIAETRQCLDRHDLSAHQAHALLHANVAAAEDEGRECDIQRLMSHITLSARLGVKQLVMHPGGYTPSLGTPGNIAIRHNIAAFRRLGDAAGEKGIQIGVENLPFRGAASAQDMLNLLEAIDHPAIGITLDTSHANMCGLDIAQMIHAFGSSLVATHISDNNGSGDQHLTPGGGTIDWPAVMAALRRTDFRGDLNLEIPGECHRILKLRRLKTCFAYEVAKWLAKLPSSEEKDPQQSPAGDVPKAAPEE